MNQNIKYVICFLLGIIISHLLFNNNNIEGLCPGQENASSIDDCSSASEETCENFYSGSGATAMSCFVDSNGSCSASSVLCTVEPPTPPPPVVSRCHSNFPSTSDDTYSIITGSNYSNYDFNSLLTSLPNNCVSSEDVISCSGTNENSGTINCSGSDSDTGIILCNASGNSSGVWELSGCMPSPPPPPPPPSTPPPSTPSTSSSSQLTCASSGSGICDDPDDFNSSGNCSGSVCTEEECCEDNTMMIIGIIFGVSIIFIIISIVIGYFVFSKSSETPQSGFPRKQ